MSKWETPLTERYWREVGGTLIAEFPAVLRGTDKARRLLDAVILPDEPFERRYASEVDLQGKEVIVVQTKARRLGMPVMGQALFSARLIEAFGPASIRSVVICTKGDSVLEPLLAEYGLELVVYEDAQQDHAADARTSRG